MGSDSSALARLLKAESGKWPQESMPAGVFTHTEGGMFAAVDRQTPGMDPLLTDAKLQEFGEVPQREQMGVDQLEGTRAGQFRQRVAR